MAFLRCPHCNAPLTEAEAAAEMCPDCANPLPSETLPHTAPTEPRAFTASPSPPGLGLERFLLIAASAVILLLCGLYAASWFQPRGDSGQIVELEEKTKDAVEQIQVVHGEKSALEQKWKAAEKALAEAAARVQSLEEDAAARKERIAALEEEKKDIQAKLAALEAFRASLPMPDKLPEMKFPEGAAVKIITIDRLDRDHRLGTFNNGAVIKLVGRVRLLRLEHIENAIVDAGELEAKTIFLTGGINNKAKVRLRARDSLTVPFIDGQAQVELLSKDGKVVVGWVNGNSRVNVTARDFTLRDYLDGNDTTLTAILSATPEFPGRLKFRDLRGRSHLFWKKSNDADPEVQMEKGIVRSTAELRELKADPG